MSSGLYRNSPELSTVRLSIIYIKVYTMYQLTTYYVTVSLYNLCQMSHLFEI